MDTAELPKDTRIYYGGDMANQSGFGTIIKSYSDKWGSHLDILMDDGREINNLPSCAFSSEFKGHGGTRFVTIAAYNDFRRNQAEGSKFFNYQEAV